MNARTRMIIVSLLLASTLGATTTHAQKYGGTLQAMARTDPPSLSIHDESFTESSWCVMPMYSNLVLFDPLKAHERLDTIIGELAESWEWREGGTALAFKLRQGVRFHDGKPFTSKDAKQMFDVVREVSPYKLKLNPRRTWYENVKEVATEGDYGLAFRLKRPQPSLLAMLATGWSPIYPAHIDPKELRTTAVGTGPFKFKEYKRGQIVEMVKNPDYFVAGRPYLDGIRFHIIRSAATQQAALVSGQVEIFGPDTPRQVMNALKRGSKELVFNEIATSSFQNLLLNTTRAPFDNPRLRQAVSMAVDRPAFIHSVYQDGMTQAGIMPPPPGGAWGLPKERLETLPGYGDPGRNLTQAREIMTSLGYGPDKPFKVTITFVNVKVVTDAAVWTVDALKRIWIEGELRQLEPAVIGSTLAKKDFDIAMNTTGISTDDPDINFFENYGCGSRRNYSGYCNPAAQKRFEAQSQMLDHAGRQAHVRETDALLINDVARIVYGFRLEYGAHWPHVKNYVHHQSAYNMMRMQEVWLAK